MSSLESKIKKAIEATGLPTEIKVTNMLRKYGWSVYNEYPFLDMQQNKIRTLDVKARKFFKNSSYLNAIKCNEDNLSCTLYIECKSSMKHSWVFHTQSMPESFIDVRISRLSYDAVYGLYDSIIKLYTKSDTLNNEMKEKVKTLLEPTSIFKKVPLLFNNLEFKIALSHQIVFDNFKKQIKNGDRVKNNFYDAHMKILKTMKHEEFEYVNDEEISIVIPIILFNGFILECYYQDNDIKVHKINYTRYLSHGLPNQKIPILIDVVPFENLSYYLEQLDKEFT